MGTPQGSVISPLLANIYLHYVFDLWVDVWRKKCARGDVVVVRYADDIVIGFQHRADADRFLKEFRERLRKFGLELHPDKTRRIEFGRFAELNRNEEEKGSPRRSIFWDSRTSAGRTGRGAYAVKRKTISKRMRSKLLEIKQQLRKRMHEPVPQTANGSDRSCRATSTTTQYRATSTVWPHSAIGSFGSGGTMLIHRGQKHHPTWARMQQLADRWLPQPRVLHPYPRVSL